jgi:hypothetical protein
VVALLEFQSTGSRDGTLTMASTRTTVAPPSNRVRLIVASSVMLTFISFWRAAAIVLCDLGSSAFYAGGISEQAMARRPPGSFSASCCSASRCARFTSRAVRCSPAAAFTAWSKEALGGTFAKLSVSALMFDYILTGPHLRRVRRAIHYRPDERTADRCGQQQLAAAGPDGRAHIPSFQFDMNYTSAVFAAAVTIYYWWQNIKGIEESSGKALRVMEITTIMVVILLIWGVFSVMVRGVHLPPPPTVAHLKFSDDALGFLKGTRLVPILGCLAF